MIGSYIYLIYLGEISQLDKCLGTCKEEACETDLDLSKGCNQMYSCSHACKIRQLGLDINQCKEQCNSPAGCSPVVNEYEFSLCGSCTRENCGAYPTMEECLIGCYAYGK